MGFSWVLLQPLGHNSVQLRVVGCWDSFYSPSLLVSQS